MKTATHLQSTRERYSPERANANPRTSLDGYNGAHSKKTSRVEIRIKAVSSSHVDACQTDDSLTYCTRD
jgi:hypothetical protein